MHEPRRLVQIDHSHPTGVDRPTNLSNPALLCCFDCAHQKLVLAFVDTLRKNDLQAERLGSVDRRRAAQRSRSAKSGRNRGKPSRPTLAQQLISGDCGANHAGEIAIENQENVTSVCHWGMIPPLWPSRLKLRLE